jgi:hypothetical protein
MLATVLKYLIIRLKNTLIQIYFKSWYHAKKLDRGPPGFFYRAETEIRGQPHILDAFEAGNGPPALTGHKSYGFDENEVSTPLSKIKSRPSVILLIYEYYSSIWNKGNLKNVCRYECLGTSNMQTDFLHTCVCVHVCVWCSLTSCWSRCRTWRTLWFFSPL